MPDSLAAETARPEPGGQELLSENAVLLLQCIREPVSTLPPAGPALCLGQRPAGPDPPDWRGWTGPSNPTGSPPHRSCASREAGADHAGQRGQSTDTPRGTGWAGASGGPAASRGLRTPHCHRHGWSPLQGSDIQVQYVQLAPVTDHTAAAQTAETLQPNLQPEMQHEHGAIQIQ
uniref:Uncharacterized protein n=1 Tax=Myotis myotis TaxID=51298 RepID=A0A7J7VZ70_MYOMY|nr:hypothetical protein mMyoMyo1_012282 [Myotis myotis]